MARRENFFRTVRLSSMALLKTQELEKEGGREPPRPRSRLQVAIPSVKPPAKSVLLPPSLPIPASRMPLATAGALKRGAPALILILSDHQIKILACHWAGAPPFLKPWLGLDNRTDPHSTALLPSHLPLLPWAPSPIIGPVFVCASSLFGMLGKGR